MSVIVKDMEMPKCCYNCEFYWEKDVLFEPMHLCEIKQEYIDNADIHSIPHDCPLTELPEKHGRLIDADALIDDCKKYLNRLNPSRDGKECTRIHWLIGVLSNAPTIEPEPQWIPCSERLPEKIEKNYWVCLDIDHHGWQCMCKWRKYPSKRGDFWGWHLSTAHVVAWMPLPEPYMKCEPNED